MSLIKIIANNIELDIVKETLTITKENNSLINDFKVSFSNFPFLIVENSKTIKALGGRDITTCNKPKIVPVIVEELNQRYYGELQILSYLNGFRKVTLKYATELLSIMDKPIASFMPVVSVIPEEISPVPYAETATDIITGSEYWETYPIPFMSQGFPDVKWQFPTMKWQDKFGKELTAEDSWFLYEAEINKYSMDLTAFIKNTFTESSSEITGVVNKNVPSPQLYLLSPLFYALQSKGFTAEGTFCSNDFVKKILIQSSKNNISETSLVKLVHTFVFSGGFAYDSYSQMHYKDISYNVAVAGNYILDYSFTFAGPLSLSNNPSLFKLFFQRPPKPGFTPSDLIFNITEITDATYTISGTQNFELLAGTSHVSYFAKTTVMPISYEVNLKIPSEKKLQQMHPTIDLGRYVPDWTFGTYLNELKKLFNLKFDIDDFRKKISLNFNEEIIENSEKEILKQSLAIKTYDQPPYTAFHLKFQNDVDTALWITSDGADTFVAQKSDFSESLESKFKIVPNNAYTAELSDDLDSKDGVGLMIYDNYFPPYIVAKYANKTLSMDGKGGIYNFFHKNWLKFRLNASPVELTGYFTEMELSKIQKLERIYVDNQDYLVSILEYSETDQNNFEVLLKVVSVNL